MRWLCVSRSGGQNRPVNCLKTCYKVPFCNKNRSNIIPKTDKRRPTKGPQRRSKGRGGAATHAPHCGRSLGRGLGHRGVRRRRWARRAAGDLGSLGFWCFCLWFLMVFVLVWGCLVVGSKSVLKNYPQNHPRIEKPSPKPSPNPKNILFRQSEDPSSATTRILLLQQQGPRQAALVL